MISIEQGRNILQQGGVIAYPTEAVYGLGCDPFNQAATDCIRQLKQRPPDYAFIVISSDWQLVRHWTKVVDEQQLQNALNSWPGHVTWIFPASEQAPKNCCMPNNTIAIRITAHPVAKALCQAFGSGIVSTSANHHGEAPAMSVEEVESMFKNDIAGIVAGPLGGSDKPSEIYDIVTGNKLR